jgi:histidinol phosphatase-like enzyme (inositol monophosphatase family)
MGTPRDPLRVAIDAALAAGSLARASRGARLKVRLKADATPVTQVDHACEELIRRRLARAFPSDGLVGEEYGEVRAGAEAVWIVDPIDGTKAFIRGFPYWGTLIARAERGRLTAGVVYLPALNELLWAARGRGAYRNGRRLRVSRTGALEDAQVLQGSLECFVRRRRLGALARLAARVRTVRGYGDCWGYTWLVRGMADAMVEAEVSPWDVAAVKIVVEEAGGRVTDWRGRDDWRGGDVVASNSRLHGAVLRALRGPTA